MGVAYCQVGLMMGVAIDPCIDSAVSDVVAKFGSEGHVQRGAGIPLVNGRECRKVMCNNYNLFRIARFNGILYSLPMQIKGHRPLNCAKCESERTKITTWCRDYSRVFINFVAINKSNMKTEIEILQYLHYNPLSKRAEILPSLSKQVSDRTLMRMLSDAVSNGNVEVVGRGPATRYKLTPQAHVTMELNLDTYFDQDIDERQVQTAFNFELINDILPHVNLFTNEELEKLAEAQTVFRKHLSEMCDLEYRKEMERLGIDLSWKSSQIEGNTYSLLETERLLKEKQTASGKTKEEAVMLLNHKDALDFILNVPEYLKDMAVARIEEIHALLTKELGVERNIRHRRVGITGTNYTPLDNEFQIREALEDTVTLINGKTNIFEKALLALVLLSYIQAFTDGNKRTARIVSNGILIANGYCPISFRTVDSVDYKKAMLMFYEQNNIAAFKRIFIEQFLFAVKTYF